MKNSKVILLLAMGLFLISYPMDESIAQNRKERSRTEKKLPTRNKQAANRTISKSRSAYQANRNRNTYSNNRSRSTYNDNRNRSTYSNNRSRSTYSNNRNRNTYTYNGRAGRTVAFRGVNYRYNNGIFYRPNGNRFVVARPPIGIRVSVLPSARIQFNFGGRPYYYYDGIYYNRLRSNYYEVVVPPIGARISQLPPFSEDIWIDRQQFYLSDGVFYKIVQDRFGRLAYEVVGYDS